MTGIQTPPEITDVDSPDCSLTGLMEHEITVSWGDCDPAQIAYTANIPAWGLLAIEHWYTSCLQANWYELNLHHGIGTPFVSLGFDFKLPVTPLSTLVIKIYVDKLGNSSLSHRIEASQSGHLCFTGKTVAAFVDASTLKPISIPPNMRSRIQQYINIQS